jgi:hypothetical protein
MLRLYVHCLYCFNYLHTNIHIPTTNRSLRRLPSYGIWRRVTCNLSTQLNNFGEHQSHIIIQSNHKLKSYVYILRLADVSSPRTPQTKPNKTMSMSITYTSSHQKKAAVRLLFFPLVSEYGGEIFLSRPDRPWGPPSLLYNGYRVSFPGVKRPGRGVDQPPHLVPGLKK